MMDTEGEEFEEEDEEYSDDDDLSWKVGMHQMCNAFLCFKVRRASARCLEAVIATRHDMLDTFYAGVAPALIHRFKGERRLID